MTAHLNRALLGALRYIESHLGNYHNTAWASQLINIHRSNREVDLFEHDMNTAQSEHSLDGTFQREDQAAKAALTPLFDQLETQITIPSSETGKTLRVGNSGFETCTHPDRRITHKSNAFIDTVLAQVNALPPNAVVMEIGGGYGGLVRAILETGPDVKITSVTADPNPIFRGMARLTEEQRQQMTVTTATVPQYNVSNLDQSFDLIIQNRFTHFLDGEALDQLTQQVASSLKPIGQLALAQLATTNGSYRDKLQGRESIPAAEALPKQSYALTGNLYPRTLSQLESVATAHGLTVDIASGYGAKQFDETNRDHQFDNIFMFATKS